MRSLLNDVLSDARARGTGRSAGRTIQIITAAKSTARPSVVPRISQAPPAVTTATTNASSVHAVTSSTAAQVMAVEPIGVLVNPRSSRMRASTGTR